MSAIVLIPIARRLGMSPEDNTLEASVRECSPFELMSGVLVGVTVCAAFALLVYALMRVLLPRRGLPAATNTVGESVGMICLFVALGQGIGTGLKALQWNDILVRLGGSILTGLVCCALLAALWRRREGGRPFPWWDVRPYRGGSVLLLVVPLVFLAFMPISMAVNLAWRCVLVLFNRPLELQEVLLAPLDRGPVVIAVFAVIAVAVVPVIEEILFRGGLYRALREELGIGAGAIVSALIFALLHFNEAAFLPLVVLSLFFVAVYEWTGSLWACIILHGCFNGLNLTLA